MVLRKSGLTIIAKCILLISICLVSACGDDPKRNDIKKEERINPISPDRIKEVREWVDENLSNRFLTCGDATFTYYNGRLIWFVNLKAKQIQIESAPTLYGNDDSRANNVVYRGKIKLVADQSDKPIMYRVYNVQKGKWEGDGENFAENPFGEFPDEFEIICQGTPGRTDENVRCSGLWVKVDGSSGAVKFPYKALDYNLARDCQRLINGNELGSVGWTEEDSKLVAEIKQYQKNLDAAKKKIEQIEGKYGEAEIRSQIGYDSLLGERVTPTPDGDDDTSEDEDKRLKQLRSQRDEVKAQYELLAQKLSSVQEAARALARERKSARERPF